MANISPERLRERIAALPDSEQGVEELAHTAAQILFQTLDFDGFCLLTTDPATIVPTGEVVENGLPPTVFEQMAAIELSGEDFNAFRYLRRTGDGAASLSAATGGDLARSMRHRELRHPHGFGDELRAALVVDGAMWGGLTLSRSSERPQFSPEEVEAVGSVAAALATAVRRSWLGEADPAEAPPPGEGGGLLLLAEDDSLTHADAAAEAWLAQLASAGRALPQVATAVAARARASANQAVGEERSARARVRSASGTWLTVRASLLRGGEEGEGRVAVIVEPTRGEELAPLRADLYGLTERERAIAQAVADGLPTAAIAERLNLSPWTVQDHLKSIFEKVGVTSRGELVTRVFLAPSIPTLSAPPLRVEGEKEEGGEDDQVDAALLQGRPPGQEG
jgi:DNA-binding CsgD family transcriptional regulator